ncbi:MAG: zinc ribbon domain-containing protein [Akkermansia sp.]|nr:zinc ribbon domain-containing protein [Akkermansia sp.]
MYCFNCGNALTEHANYCHHCGTRVHHPVLQNNGNSVVVPLPSNASTASSTRRSIIEYNVVLKSTKQTSNVTLVKQLLMSFNPKWDASDCERALNRTTVVYSGPRQQALAVASQFSKAGTIVSVESETGQVLASSEYSGNFPPIPAASPCAASSPYFAPSSQPSTSIRWGCLVVVGGVFLIGLASVIATAIKKERENRAKPELFAGSAAPKVSAPSKPVAPKVDKRRTDAVNSRGMDKKSEPKKAKILDDALHILPTKKGVGYDKTIKRYGVKRIKKINELLPKVAEKAALTPGMDEIYCVDVSDNRSTDKQLVFYADASNGKRVYITEDDLKTNEPPKAEQDKLKALVKTHEQIAETFVKSLLHHPSTYDRDFGGMVTHTGVSANVVEIHFSAKNDFNLELSYVARVWIDADNKIADYTVTEKK